MLRYYNIIGKPLCVVTSVDRLLYGHINIILYYTQRMIHGASLVLLFYNSVVLFLE